MFEIFSPIECHCNCACNNSDVSTVHNLSQEQGEYNTNQQNAKHIINISLFVTSCTKNYQTGSFGTFFSDG